MKKVLHKAESRGFQNHGWLVANHTFSFANYYDSSRMHFGNLRVLNDDYVAVGQGFGMHPHANMEIVTIPLSGELHHRDSMGNFGAIQKGEIQVMSAGTGVQHSEFNGLKDQAVTLLQIWVFPNRQNVEPRYQQIRVSEVGQPNEFRQIVSPFPEDEGAWIHQEAWLHLAEFDQGVAREYSLKKEGNGVYVFVISGEVRVSDEVLSARDGLGIYETSGFRVEALEASEVLLIEVPMQLPRI
ncbi:pirin family protein [Bergeyella sp. RCAD1439]|uniref:pirin family protein n=1 Tax=Bergeyella anatis TaxID=3113737 RepID=UPI002E17FF57|nr:pirin family protein [Bergeyella sp. RCAD1439]